MDTPASGASPKIIVTGSTGFIGGQCLQRWVGTGMEVMPVVRTEAQREACSIQPCLLFEELTPSTLRDLGWHDACILHLAGTSRDRFQCSMQDSIVGTTQVVCETARSVGLQRIVYLSGYGVTADSTEPYFRAKSEAEQTIRSAGIPTTIFQPSFILGPGDELTPYLVSQLRGGRVEIPGSGLYRIQPLHVDDVVAILTAAVADSSANSQVLPLLGEPITYIDFVRSLALRVAPEAEIVPISFEQFMRRMLISPDPDFTISELCVLICDCVGPPTQSCFGKTVLGLNSILERLVAEY